MSGTRTRKGTREGRPSFLLFLMLLLHTAFAVGACRGGGDAPPKGEGPDSLPRALALGLALFEKSPEGKQVPQPATAIFLVFEGGSWQVRRLVDEDSNVFHKVMEYSPAPSVRRDLPGISCLGNATWRLDSRRAGEITTGRP